MCCGLALATNTMSGATFRPLVMMLLMSSWYCMVFLLTQRVSTSNMSLHYVNSMNYMLSSGAWASGGGGGGCMGGL